MKTIDEIDGLSSQDNAKSQTACDELTQPLRDPEAARQSRIRMAAARDELRKRVGVQKVVVDIVRQTRKGR